MGDSGNATGLAVATEVSALAHQMELDFNFIQRNVRDLSVAAQFSHLNELQELHKLAFTNLREQMAPGRPLSVDPGMVLEAYKTISSVVMATVETKRKAAETLLKARTLVDVPDVAKGTGDNDLLVTDDAFDEDVSSVSLSTGSGAGTGLYGELVGSATGQEAVQDAESLNLDM